MILQIPPEGLSSSTMQAVLSVEKTLSAFESPDKLVSAGESVLSILQELRRVGEQEPDRRAHLMRCAKHASAHCTTEQHTHCALRC
jgi:hypothetical protein